MTMGTALDMFLSNSQIKVLKLLLLNRDQGFYQREIAERSGLRLRAVQQVLARLVDGGLLLREKRGRQVYYRANPASPILPELTAIFVKTVGLADILSEALEELTDQVEVAFIYGSWARGENRPESDVDLFVIGSAGPRPVISALSGPMLELGRELNPVVMSPAELAQRISDNNHFVKSVLDGPKMYLIGGDNDLRRIIAQGAH